MALMGESSVFDDSRFGNFTGSVNGKLTGCPPGPFRSIYRTMDTKAVLGRVERRLKAVNKKADAVSKEAGKPDAIRNLRRAVKGDPARGITVKTIAALAPILETTVPWLLEEVGPETPGADEVTVPVWGKAGAGGNVFHFHHDGRPIGNIALPDWFIPKSTTAAIQIDGDSLGATYNGWYAIYDEVRDPPTVDLIGHPCVTETAEGHVYVKKLKKGRGKRFTLESDFAPPIYDVELRWAAKVKAMVPP